MSKNYNKSIKLRSVVLLLFFIFLTIIFAIYVDRLLFSGDRSFMVYETLLKQKVSLQKQIKQLQKENAKLQKYYFELKNLEPEE